MSEVVVDVKAVFQNDVEYVLSTGIIVTYQDGYLCDRNGNIISTDDYPVLPMINYHPQVKAGPVPKEKEVWQFEDGEQPKLLSNNYVVETENFKRVGEWLVGFNPKEGVNQVISLDEVSEFKQSSCNVVFNNCGEWILEGTVLELLQVLA